jgi:hypothetical protein
MANHCWNWAKITGPKETLDIIEERFNKYYEMKDFTFTEFSRMVLGLEPDVVPEHETNDELFNRIYRYGTKWWEFEIERGVDWMELRGDSAWSPPIGLLTMMTKVFDVKIEGEYSESGCDFGGFYTIENGVCDDREMTYFEYELESDRDNAIGRLIDDINEEFLEIKYVEDNYKQYLTEEEWNELVTETNNK